MTRPDGAVLFDELVRRTQTYRTSAEYLDNLRVVAALQDFSPFNAYLLRLQRPMLRFAAARDRWEDQFGRKVRTDRPAYPLVILRPFGPVDFVFDYEDTVGEDLPQSVLEPFRASGYVSREDWERLFHNARRRGVVTEYSGADLSAGGSIEPWGEGPHALPVPSAGRPLTIAEREAPPVRFRVVLDGRQDKTVQYVTLLHELGHLACGHLGGLPSDDWPQREREALAVCEFEAESVAYIVCRRLGFQTNSEEYLSDYVRRHEAIPAGVSVYTVLKAAGLLEDWARKLSWPRKLRREAAERALRRRREDESRA